jgi:protein-disulfide isomerase
MPVDGRKTGRETGDPMMKALTLCAALAAASFAGPALAFDPAAMSDAERDAFRAEIRAYLMENPEVLMEAIGVLEERRQGEQVASDANLVTANAEALFDDERSWVGGNPDGDITIVEFMDYRCGYCKKAFPEVDALLKADGNIRFIVKEFPILGEQSVLAARFAISVRNLAGPASYEKVHNELMTLRADISAESLAALSDRLGLDTAKIMAGMDAAAVDAELRDNQKLAQALQINGTPGFVFVDQLVRGYVPLDAMQDIVASLRG